LSIPESFRQRDLLITMTFGVVVLSIPAQGITVGPALRWLGLRRSGHAATGYAETQTALLSAHSALADLERTGSMVTAYDEMRRVLATEYDEQIDHAVHQLAALGERLGSAEAATLAARRLLRETERKRVLGAYRAGAIGADERDRRLIELNARWWDQDAVVEHDGASSHEVPMSTPVGRVDLTVDAEASEGEGQ
jgi:CPA1 family monovalent cation:H+ antiporter